jgi:predicted acylesterase/phospholipase RssA
MKRMSCVVVMLLVAAGAMSCHRRVATRVPERTCLVLSVGGPKGLAHLGAIDALREHGVRVDCVVGNSMGAVVGSLYASAPQEDLKERYRGFFAEYERETVKEAGGRGAVGAALGFLAVILSGGSLAPAVAVGALGAAGGAATVPKLSHKRFLQVLDDFYGGAQVEDLPVPFATSYQEATQHGLRRTTVTHGNLAEAVAASAANPFIFPDADVHERIDPGADRVSAVPVHDACALFPGARLIAINVTEEPAYYRGDIGCEVREILVATDDPPAEAMQGAGPEFEEVYSSGYDAVSRELAARPL